MLYTLNLYNAICQLQINKTENKKKSLSWQILGYVCFLQQEKLGEKYITDILNRKLNNRKVIDESKGRQESENK